MNDMNLLDELAHAEALLIEGQNEEAQGYLARLAEDAEEYVDRNCHTTSEVQWFSFPTLFERLAYRRVEGDPRELRDVGEPLDRLYNDLALAAVRNGDYDTAMEALRQAVRWNPMGCEYRLNLADLYRIAGDPNEYLALSFSVFERASEARHLVRAFVNFSEYFQVAEKPACAAAALRAARRFGLPDSQLDAALELAAETDHDPDAVSDDEAHDLLAQEGLPDGANAEVAVCLLMCASDAAALGQRDVATDLTIRARDLVGEKTCKALLALIRQGDGDDGDDGDGEGGADDASATAGEGGAAGDGGSDA
jgi:tetratricopeptide (TPR) repeat protein